MLENLRSDPGPHTVRWVSAIGGGFIVDRGDLETFKQFGPWFRDPHSGEWRNGQGGFAADLILCPTCRRDKVVYRNGLNDLRREHLRLSECRPN